MSKYFFKYIIYFMYNHLIWKEENRKIVYSCPVFDVTERISRSPKNKAKTFSVLEAPDFAIIIPALDTEKGREFIMVRQWRHGIKELSLEFPGGIIEKNEDCRDAALRELKEETGYSAKKITKLGELGPNPAIMSNTAHFFLAEDLTSGGPQDLDEDEYVSVETVPWKDVLKGMGKAPYVHALMATALALYLKHVDI